MAKIAIVTDSSANIPQEYTKDLPIYSVPLHLLWGEKNLKDTVDITPADFYEEMKKSPLVPSTSEPSPEEMIAVYKPLLDQGYDIFSIHIAEKLSKTLNSAIQARQTLDAENIAVFDSRTTSMGLGLQILAIARAIAAGANLRTCLDIATKARERTGVYFIVSSLEYLRRGGRIGGAAAFLGTLLNLKPLLTIQNGQIEPVEQIRSLGRAIDRMLNLFEEDVKKLGAPARLACLHSDDPEMSAMILEKSKQRLQSFQVEESFTATLSPVIGCHAGPGTMGICYLAGM